MISRAKSGSVLAVCFNPQPGLPKPQASRITLIEDWGVQGDYHAGKTIRHRYLARKDPTRPNNRQVLLVDTVIHKMVREKGIQLAPGDLGENILVEGIDLMALPVGTRLQVGSAILELTEIRDPCSQLDGVHPGLHRAVEIHTADGIQSQAGMLGVIIRGGIVRPEDTVQVIRP
jgi:MOSC domain-containing protein YiiM